MKQFVAILSFCFLFLLLFSCKNGSPGPDSMTELDKTNTQPNKNIAENCTEKCHKAGTFLDPVIINREGLEGKHKKHVEERGLPCSTCHYEYQGKESHRNNILDTENPDVRLVYFNNINWNPDDNRRGYWDGDQGIVNGKKTGGCKEIYCHGDKPNGGDPEDYPLWYEDISFECTYCHNPGAPIDPTTNYARFPEESHSQTIVQNYNGEACTTSGCHDGTSGIGNYKTSALIPANAHPRHVLDVGFECTMCHLDYKKNLSHANGILDSALDAPLKINFDPVLNPGASYDATNKTCDNLYCHGNTWGDENNSRNIISKGTDTTPVWTDLTTGDCGNCHLADPSHVQGAHKKHLDPPYSFPCYKCHFDNRNIAKEDENPLSRQDHHVKEGMPVNGEVNVVFDVTTLPINPTGIFDPENKTCSSLYCHGTKLPQGGAGTDMVPDWEWGGDYGKRKDQIPPVWCGSCHDADIADSSPGTIRDTGQHVFHLSDPSDDSGGPQNGPGIVLCTRCHPGTYSEATENSSTFVHSSAHVNGVISYSDSTLIGVENLWLTGLPGPMVDFTIDEDKGCTASGCHAAQPVQIDYVHSDLKKKASYNTISNPDASADNTGTNVCNVCHSPGGDYNGVADPEIGSKFNWTESVYYSGTSEDFNDGINRTILKPGKEMWCAGCHDKDPSQVNTPATLDVTLDAPRVIGDETAQANFGTGWGYFVSGHGVPTDQKMPWTGTATEGGTDGRPAPGLLCTKCHNPKLRHIKGNPDGNNRTFNCTANPSCDSVDYYQGYRLRLVSNEVPLKVPLISSRFSYWSSDLSAINGAVNLCFSCHDSNRFTTWPSTPLTNFRTPPSSGNENAHANHITLNGAFKSDWRSSSAAQAITCITCHNPHGSSQHAMLRNGWLTGGKFIKLLYSKTGTTDSTTDANCQTMENGLPKPIGTPIPTVLLGDSDGYYFCTSTLEGSGSGLCARNCHSPIGSGVQLLNRPVVVPLTYPN